MKSKIASLFKRIHAVPVRPDVDAMNSGVGDLRFAMGINDLPEDKPVMYFLFQNSDRGPERRYWEVDTEAAPSNALNCVSQAALKNPGKGNSRSFDRQHYLEMASENTRPTLPANLAMAVSIKDHRQFEQVALRAGRAFLTDAASAGDLSLTIAYLPPVDAKWPMQPPYQVTFKPALDPIMPAAQGKDFDESRQVVTGEDHTALVTAIGVIKRAMKMD